MDIGMNSYDQFVSEESSVSVAAAADVKEAATSQIRLNLSNNSSIYLLLTLAEGSILGKGNVTSGNVTGPAEAVGRLIANKLSLDVTALGGEVYKFSLAAEGSSVLGDYSLADARWRTTKRNCRRQVGDLKRLRRALPLLAFLPTIPNHLFYISPAFDPGENLFMRRFIFILPAPPLMPLIAFCMA